MDAPPFSDAPVLLFGNMSWGDVEVQALQRGSTAMSRRLIVRYRTYRMPLIAPGLIERAT